MTALLALLAAVDLLVWGLLLGAGGTRRSSNIG
jgi:hypothetical protein